MADVNGARLEKGDHIRVVRVDDPTYKFLEGTTGTVDTLPQDDDEVREEQVFLLLDHESIPALSTQQSCVEKVEG